MAHAPTPTPTPTPSTDDAKALDLLKASGVLNPNVTLDKLMDVTRQLADLQPASGPKIDAKGVFIGNWYVFKTEV
jgi:hypothetical protein